MGPFERSEGEPSQIRCLACGESRVVFGSHVEDTGGCPHCGYVGWTYAEDLDGTTKQIIMSGLLKPPSGGTPVAAGRDIRRSRSRRASACHWRRDHGAPRSRSNAA